MILIAIGANLAGKDGMVPIEMCAAAAEAIRAIPGLEFVALSPWYRTRAIPASSQPDYCNGMIRMRGEIDPATLLRQLHEIEAKFGRERSLPNAARTLDLDIIDMAGTIRATPDPVLPHPRAHLRAFVLRPLLDVNPAWRHPVLKQNVTTLLAVLPPQAIEPWHDDL
ncbi:MAG: 2-amino-4-hydroxy-6-hydroxymethyldihydropteridine diphosphokinase [Proteobacteria bacterium]|nr:2-amino-4-hydroxy-6-hydroxymethyldihydropteridine diphosphokinase [Pseudomonadota bacterium]MBU6425421.1 2-amino-4-hydroxy-6-hydroxymethyldihydropteridine diphosphokinase [Rhodospirillales bacterium]